MPAPNLPGHGERGRPRAGLSLRDMADEIVGWTSGELDVIGALLGGVVALHLALEYPHRVRSLFLVGTSARLDASVMEQRAHAVEENGTPVDDTLARWFDPDTLALDPEPPPVSYARRCLRDVDPASFAQSWRALGEHDVLARLSQIRVPTTWVATTRDLMHPPAAVASLCQLLPRGRFVAIEGPHMAPLACPQTLGQTIRDHLAWADGHAT